MHPSPPNPFGDLPYRPAGQEELVKAELVPEETAGPGERLSILHLMVWTACTALILAFYRQSMSLPESSINPAWLRVVTALVGAPIQGACVASLLLVLWRKAKGGRPFPRQPGHWLLVIPGVVTLLSWPWWMLILLVMNSNMSVYVFFYRIPLLVLFCGLAVFAIGRLRSEPRWRAMFTVWLLANLVAPMLGCIGPGMMGGRGTLEPLLGTVVGLGFLVPAIQDHSQGIRRDHFHYAGVACRVANVGMGIIQLVRVFLLY
jgi:hypothetical protein